MSPQARAVSAGLVLRASEPLRVFDIGRYGVQHGPATAHHCLIDHHRSDPDISEHAAVPVGSPYILLQPRCCSLRQQPGQCFTCTRRDRTLSSLRAVDPDQPHSSAVATGKSVPIDYMTDDTAGLLCLGLARGTGQQQNRESDCSNERERSSLHA